MLGGFVGVVAGTTIADRLAARGVRDGEHRIGAAACAANGALALLLPWLPTAAGYMVLIGLTTACSSAGIALGPAALGEIAPGEIRGQALAACQLVATVIGAGLGPPLVALLARWTGFPIGTALSIVSAAALALGALGSVAGCRRFGREVDQRVDRASVHSGQ